jgi:carbon storage regulator CsrA
MFVMSRQVGEAIMIGDGVEIVVTKMRAKRVALLVKLLAVGGRFTFEDVFDVQLNEGDEPIRLPGNVTCEIVQVGGEKARIGICAPESTSIHRREVYDAIKRENRRDRGNF